MLHALSFASNACIAPRQLDLAALRAARPGRRPIPLKRETNPMPRAEALPGGNSGRGDLRLAARCEARCKRDHRPCRQPAMRGKRVCRMHGGKGGAPRGKRNGGWRHGFCTRAYREPLRALLRYATDGRVLGVTSSGGYGHTIGKSIVYGYVPTEDAKAERYEIEAFTRRIPATRIDKAPYDPDRKKLLA